MIWVDGRIVEAERLALPMTDRIFEHGLGLFETFRTWDGQARLLGRHLDRMRRSAHALGISLDDGSLPTLKDVGRLLDANHSLPDSLVRLTASAGRAPDLRSTPWMTVAPLPAPPPRHGQRVVDAPWTVSVDDPLARHKTLNYWSKRIAHEQAQASGADEAVFSSGDGRIWEASRGNLFVILGRDLVTSPESGPIVPGIMRRLVLDRAGPCGFSVAEADLDGAMIGAADEIFLTNSVRGLIPVGRWSGRDYRPTDPTFPTTSRLQAALLAQLTPASPQV